MKTTFSAVLFVACLVAGLTTSTNAQQIRSSGDGPTAVAFNPIENKAYIANEGGNSVTIFDADQNVTIGIIATGIMPVALAADPVGNRTYVANKGSSTISVVDAVTDIVTGTISVCGSPTALGLDPGAFRLFVSCETGSIEVYDTGTLAQIGSAVVVGGSPGAVSTNPASGKAYVVNETLDTVHIIRGSDASLLDSLPTGSQPVSISVNPVTEFIYVANELTDDLTVIDGSTDTVEYASVSVGGAPVDVSVNPVTNVVYVANSLDGTISVFVGATSSTAPDLKDVVSLPASSVPVAIGINTVANRIAVADQGNEAVCFVEGYAPLSPIVPLVIAACLDTDPDPGLAPSGDDPVAVGVNPVTGIYISANNGGDSFTTFESIPEISIIDILNDASDPFDIVLDEARNLVFTSHLVGSIGIYDGESGSELAIVPAASAVYQMAYDPVRRILYGSNRSTAQVIAVDISLAGGPYPSRTIDLLLTGPTGGISPFELNVNPVTGKVYVPALDDDATYVIHGTTISFDPVDPDPVVKRIPTTGRPRDTAIDIGDNLAFASDIRDGNLHIIDGASDLLVATVDLDDLGLPNQVRSESLIYDPVDELVFVSDPNNDRIHVVSSIAPFHIEASIQVEDNPKRMDLNPVTKRLYVTNQDDDSVSIINTETLTLVEHVDVGDRPRFLAVNPVSNRVYTSNENSEDITVITGDNTPSTLAATETVGFAPKGLAVNTLTNAVFIAGRDVAGPYPDLGDKIVRLRPFPASEVPIVTSIQPITADESDVRSVSLSLSAISSFSPVAPPIQGIWYQFDSQSGPWVPASPSGTAGSTDFRDLAPGLHTLFAFATDGQEATSIGTGVDSSPLVGAITAYQFLVAPKADLRLSLATDTVSPELGDLVTLTVSLANDGPEYASGVTVETTLPSGLTYVSNSEGAAESGGVVTWSTPTLLSGASRLLEIQATTNSSGTTGDDYTVHSQVVSVAELDPDSTPSSATAPNVDAGEDDEAIVRLGFVLNLPPGTTTFSIIEDPAGSGLATLEYSDGVTTTTLTAVPVATLGKLTINPAPGDAVDFTIDPNTVPADGIQVNGNGDETLTFTNPSPAVDSAQYEMTADQEGSVTFGTTGPVSFEGVSAIDDQTLVDDRGFGLADGGDTIILSENGAPTDESLLDTGLGTLISFKDPADLLSLTGSNGADEIEIQELELATASLEVDSGNGSDTIAVFAGTYPSTINGGNGSDQLTVLGPASSPIDYDVTGAGEGTVTFGTGESFEYEGFESVEDPLDVAVRTFVTSGSTGETITLSDDGVGADGISLLDTGLEHTISFRNPTTSLSLSGSAGADDIDFLGLDTQFLPAVLVIDGLGSEDDIFVSPVSNLPITVHGGAPGSLPGDFLDIEDAAGGVLTLGDPLVDPTYGTYTFPGDLGTVTFDGIEATAESDLSISVTPATIHPADTTPIVFTVTNNGTNSATGVQVEVPAYLIANLAGLTSAVTGGSFASPIWTIGLLEPGAVVTLTLEGLLNSIVPATLTIEISNPPLNQNADNDSQAQTSSPGFTLPAKSHPKSILYTQYEFGGLKYDRTLIGLFQGSPGLGGSVLCKIPQPPSGLFTAAGLGPVFRLCSDGLPFPLNINDLFEDESGTIWALTWGHAGLYRSDDKGITWTAASPEVRDGSSTWTNVYAMTQDQAGALYISTDNGTVFRSLNDGESWQQVGSVQGIASGTPWALEASLSTPGTVYAGSFGSGVFVTTNFGFAWEELPGNATLLAANAGHIFDLEISPIDTSVLFAATGRGVYRYDLDTPGWVFVGPEIELPEGSGTLVRPEMRSIDFDVTGATLGGASWGLGVFLNSAPLTTGVFAETAIREGYVSVIQAAPGGGFGLGLEGGGLQSIGTDAASSVFVESDASGSIPSGFALEQNYPNPFNPVTRIAFSLPEASTTRLEVYDLLGRHVSTLVDGTMPAGVHQVHFDAGTLPSGTYLYTLTTGGRLFTKTLVLLK